MHSGNPEDVQLALDAMSKKREDEDPSQERVIILISSLLAWDNTPRNLEEIRSPEDIAEEERLVAEAEAKAKAEAEAAAKGPDDSAEGGEEKPSEVAASEVLSNNNAAEESKVLSNNGESLVAEGAGAGTPETKPAETAAAPVQRKRKRFLHHPFEEKDFAKRAASREYAKIKEVEDRVLNFKKENVKTYVISAGVLYGLGEAIFNHHFERAWKQDPVKLPVVGEGKNFVPTIHVKDLARMVKKIFEAPPEQQYIFGIDNTKRPTQRKLIQAISDGIGTGLVESCDIPLENLPVHPKQTPLNLLQDWKKFVMLNIKARPSRIFVPEQDAPAGGEDEEEAAPDEGGFQWHCKNGLAANIQLVKEEFCKKRGLKPFKIAISGKPCSGKSYYGAKLAQHYDVPHIHKEQVLSDIQGWNKEKEAEYRHRQDEKERIRKLNEERAAEEKRKKDEEERLRLEAEEEEKRKRREELGSEASSQKSAGNASPPASPR